MHLHDGWLQNLSQLKRADTCTLIYTKKILTFDMIFGWDEFPVSEVIYLISDECGFQLVHI